MKTPEEKKHELDIVSTVGMTTIQLVGLYKETYRMQVSS